MSGVDKPIMDKAAELFGWAYGLGGFDVAVQEFVKFVRAQSDARIAELDGALLAEQMQAEDLSHELAALKAQGVVMPDVNAAAKALCNRHAMICGVDADDQWKEYIQDFIADAETVLANARLNASPAAPAADAGLVEAIDWLDDFVARCNGDDRGSCDSVNVIRAALAAHCAKGVV